MRILYGAAKGKSVDKFSHHISFFSRYHASGSAKPTNTMVTSHYLNVAVFGLELIIISCLTFPPIVSAYTFKEETFHTIKSSDNVELCAASTPSIVTSVLSKIDCANRCQSENSQRCDGFNFDDATFQCNLYDYRPQQYVSNVTDCQYYRRGTDEPCQPTIYQQVNATQCSFPYTLNGNLYYNCTPNAWLLSTNNCQQQYQCYMDKMILATCMSPFDYEVMVMNSTVSVPGQPDTSTLVVNGWIAFMWRKTGSGDGNWALNWTSYVNGFGSNSSYLWLGLERLARLTSSGKWRLRMEFRYSGTWSSVEYWTFAIGGSATSYTLNVDGYYSSDFFDVLRTPYDAWDLMYYYNNVNGKPFSTLDKDSSFGCAPYYGGGWWYYNCGLFRATGVEPVILSDNEWHTVSDVHLMLKARITTE